MNLQERFWAKVNKTDRCWLWTGSVDGYGYGRIGVSGRNCKASRVVWEMVHGPISNGLFVLHHCDNPPCVNPDHLFLGTDLDNATDKITKGRHRPPKGEQHTKAKLTNELVIKIRNRFAGGDVTLAYLGREHGVTYQSIRNVVLRQSWRHI